MSTEVISFFHQATSTFSHVVIDRDTHHAAIIDSVLDYDADSGWTSTVAADEIIAMIQEQGLTVAWILETHAHADHMSAAAYLQEKLGGRIGIGEGICEVQQTFQKVFNLTDQLHVDGSQFDHLFKDHEQFKIGDLQGHIIHTPGHTNDSVTYVIGNAAFVGDTLFMPDYGSARCDFPGGDTSKMYHAVQRIFDLPDDTRLFLCHDYVPTSSQRQPSPCVSVAEQKSHNIHLHVDTTEEEFVALRQQRDAQLPVPKLIIPAIQVNIGAGHMPEAEENGVSYLKVPLNYFGKKT